MNFTDTRIFRFVATGMAFAIFNLAAPQGVMTLMAPDPNAPKPAPPIEKTPKRTRLLTAKVMRTTQGRVGGNPYLAGQSKWDVLYKGVNLMTGNYSFSATDISYEGGYGIPVNVTRSYSSNGADEGPMGYGWNLSVDVRSTAGGLLKSAGAPVRSIPTSFKERPTADNDPRVMDANEPVAAVIATDAGGQEETIQKDVDGILTTPPWDKNVIDSEYEFVTIGSSVYQVVKKNIVKTLDGTLYHYSKHGSYPNGLTPRSGGATGEPSNVLKIDKAIDRHGNETLYTYATASPVTFAKSNGTVTEERLVDIKMPNGHHIGFEWTGNRITKAKDLSHSGTTVLREWTYGYTSGRLTTATSPGGKVTTYGYGDAAPMVFNPNFPGTGPTPSTGLLTSITDPRGLTTTIHYVMGRIAALPTGAILDAPVAYRVTQPNGVRSYVHIAGAEPPPTDTPWISYQGIPVQVRFCDRVGAPNGALINAGAIGIRAFTTSGGVPVLDVKVGDNLLVGTISPGTDDPGDHQSSRRYHYFTQDLLWERKSIFPKPELTYLQLPDLAAERRAVAPSWNLQRIETTAQYNFMGNPLEQSVVESSRNASTNAWTISPAKAASYAYWGPDKYYQQKAVRVNESSGGYRYTFSDYYDVNAAQGMKGQAKAVYDAKHATYSLGSSWKYDIQPASGSHPVADFPLAGGTEPASYDMKGRQLRVRKLSKVASGTPIYVETRISYGLDTDGSWGGPTQVVVAHGTPVAQTTYTNSYTSDGKPSHVQNPSGQTFQTNYGLDGEVNWVKRTDSGLNQTVSSFSYGTLGIQNGVLVASTDHLSGVTQLYSYITSGGGIGQVGQVDQSGGGVPSYAVTHSYNPAGERSETTYTTPNGNSKWSFGDYVRLGDPTSGTRAFQTMRKLDASSSVATSEEFQYAYDSSGRLVNAMFGQTPQSGAGAPLTAPYYTNAYPAQTRFQACYESDAGGRTKGVYHRWDTWDGSQYTGTPVLANECQYNSQGLKTQSQMLTANSTGNGWTIEGTEIYEYESGRDLLVGVDYDGSGPSAPITWSYDASLNRSNSGYSYDPLNRMTNSPGSIVYTHDAMGNRLTKGSLNYGWDILNRLISLSGPVSATYTYRGDGLRVSKTVGAMSTAYRYDDQMAFQEVETSGGSTIAVTEYSLGSRRVDGISRATGSGTTVRYPFYDAHGNCIATVSSAGPNSLNDRKSYDVWGGIRTGPATGFPFKGYGASLGHSRDDESDLIYMRARYYEPTNGRFISSDPSMEGINWYSYCDNQPTNYVDATGRWKKPPEVKDGKLGFYLGHFAVGMLFAAITIQCAREAAHSPAKVAAAWIHTATLTAAVAIFNFDQALDNTTFEKPNFMRLQLIVEGFASGLGLLLTMVGKAQMGSFAAQVATSAAFTYSLMVMGALVGAIHGD